jgi:hypothetical protein
MGSRQGEPFRAVLEMIAPKTHGVKVIAVASVDSLDR